jgi:hypothetical protein
MLGRFFESTTDKVLDKRSSLSRTAVWLIPVGCVTFGLLFVLVLCW